MKTLVHILSVATLLLIMTSCSNSDNGSAINMQYTGNYYPLTLNNYWIYDVENSNLDLGQTQTTRDSLYVVAANANTFELAVNGIAAGTWNILVSQLPLTRNNQSLHGSGALTLPLQGLSELQIPIDNAVFYNVTASNNDTLSLAEGFVEETVEGLPIVYTYSVKTTQINMHDSIILNNDSYTNVAEATLVLTLTITTEIEVVPENFVEVLIMERQNVLEMVNYFAKDIGLVRSETDISYHLEDFAQVGITLPFSGSLNATSLQELDTFGVAEE